MPIVRGRNEVAGTVVRRVYCIRAQYSGTDAWIPLVAEIELS